MWMWQYKYISDIIVAFILTLFAAIRAISTRTFIDIIKALVLIYFVYFWIVYYFYMVAKFDYAYNF